MIGIHLISLCSEDENRNILEEYFIQRWGNICYHPHKFGDVTFEDKSFGNFDDSLTEKLVFEPLMHQ